MKITKSQLKKIIRESIVKNVKQYITEQQQQGPGLKQRISAKSAGGNKDQVSIDKLMMALDGMEKGGKKAVSFDDLVAVAKKSIEVAAPLGKGSAQGLAQRATSKTGGAPVVAPPANLNQPRQEGKKKSGKKLDEEQDDVASRLDSASNLPTAPEDEIAMKEAITHLTKCIKKVRLVADIADNDERDEVDALYEILNNLLSELKILKQLESDLSMEQ